MAAKRKCVGSDDAVSRKKFRRGVQDEEEAQSNEIIDEAYASDDSLHSDYDDPIVTFKDDGTKRAESEARRQWNYVCDFQGCGQRFNRPCRLNAHMRSHTRERPFACPHDDCDKTFPRKDHLQRHLKNGHSEVEGSFVCDWNGCGKTFTSNGRLQRHKDVHESKFYCTGYPPCNEHFRKEKALEAHIKSTHLEVKPYPCSHVDNETGERCTKGYETEGALRRHMVKTHSEKEDRHFCMICIPPGDEVETIQTEAGVTVTIPKEPLSFATNEELLAHAHEHHPPICSECGLKFKNQSNLKSHFEIVHTDPASQPQYPCPKPNCDRVFNRLNNLNVHIRCVHEKEVRFHCTSDGLENSKHPDIRDWDGKNACGAPFKAKSSLEQHIRTHHLGLENRKTTRKIAKAKKEKPKPSALTLLTGIGYEEGRNVPCLINDCEFRFFMDRDLRRHLRAAHKWSDKEIKDAILERDALAGGQFWIGGLDPMLESTEPSVPQTPAPYYLDLAMPPNSEGYKPTDPQLGPLDQPFDFSMWGQDEAELEMDQAMGLSNVPALDVHDGLMWDLLAPVEQHSH